MHPITFPGRTSFALCPACSDRSPLLMALELLRIHAEVLCVYVIFENADRAVQLRAIILKLALTNESTKTANKYSTRAHNAPEAAVLDPVCSVVDANMR